MPVLEERVHFDWTNIPRVSVGNPWAHIVSKVRKWLTKKAVHFFWPGKIKYIRDFFITLFFAALGMQIPVPSLKPILLALLVSITVLLFRWLGIFLLVYMCPGPPWTLKCTDVNIIYIYTNVFISLYCKDGQAVICKVVPKRNFSRLFGTCCWVLVLQKKLMMFDFKFSQAHISWKHARTYLRVAFLPISQSSRFPMVFGLGGVATLDRG